MALTSNSIYIYDNAITAVVPPIYNTCAYSNWLGERTEGETTLKKYGGYDQKRITMAEFNSESNKVLA